MFYKVFVSLWESFLNFYPTEKWLLQFSQGLHSWVWKGQLLSFSIVSDAYTEVNSKIKLQILWLCCLMTSRQELSTSRHPSISLRLRLTASSQLQEAWLLEIYMDFSSIFEESVRIKRHLKILLLAVHKLFPSSFVLWQLVLKTKQPSVPAHNMPCVFPVPSSKEHFLPQLSLASPSIWTIAPPPRTPWLMGWAWSPPKGLNTKAFCGIQGQTQSSPHIQHIEDLVLC